ncbi:MAG TPA: 50S ribosomal protein L25, partial [Candidatus Sulfotelmatobacter sp.]|nr:50S ribosomal protein L25 [Candidatus Sulfotelmatobacter sp.]
MSAQVEIVEARPRPDSSRGKNEARRLRVSGRVPAVIYGAKKKTLAVSVDPKQINRILTSVSGHNTIFDLQVDGEKSKVMIVDWQYEPLKGKLLHIDLKRIAMDEKIRVMVPIHLVGEPAGVKQQGGILDQVVREVEIECLPGDIPSHIDA